MIEDESGPDQPDPMPILDSAMLRRVLALARRVRRSAESLRRLAILQNHAFERVLVADDGG